MNSSTRRESVESASRGTAQGRVTAVRGSVVDIRFDKHLPPIYSLLRAGVVFFSLLAALIVSLFTLKYLPRLPFGRQLILDTELPTDEGFVSAPQSDLTWQGKTGRAVSPLRPAGIADIESHRVDVVSDGEFIETGAPIIVSRVDGNRIAVRRHQSTTEGS